MKNKKWYEHIPAKLYINITFTKLVGLYIILAGIKTNNIEFVKVGAFVLIGRKFGSALMGCFIKK
jgi:hypothetical protein